MTESDDEPRRSSFGRVAPACILVPRIITRGRRGAASDLVIHAVAAEAWRGREGAEWREENRQRAESVFSHVGVSACWPVNIVTTSEVEEPAARDAIRASAADDEYDGYDDYDGRDTFLDAIPTDFGVGDAGDATTLILRCSPNAELRGHLHRAAVGRACAVIAKCSTVLRKVF